MDQLIVFQEDYEYSCLLEDILEKVSFNSCLLPMLYHITLNLQTVNKDIKKAMTGHTLKQDLIIVYWRYNHFMLSHKLWFTTYSNQVVNLAQLWLGNPDSVPHLAMKLTEKLRSSHVSYNTGIHRNCEANEELVNDAKREAYTTPSSFKTNYKWTKMGSKRKHSSPEWQVLRSQKSQLPITFVQLCLSKIICPSKLQKLFGVWSVTFMPPDVTFSHVSPIHIL